MTYTRTREPDNNDACLALGMAGYSWNFPFTDYSQLKVADGQTKPTEAAIAAKLAQLKDEWTNSDYQRKRVSEYPNIGDQLDNLYKDMLAGRLDHTGEWAKSIKATKDKYPKS